VSDTREEIRLSFTLEKQRKKDDERDVSAMFEIDICLPEFAPPERHPHPHDALTVQVLRRASEVPIVIDDGVSRVVDEPRSTASPRLRYLINCSSKSNRAFVSNPSEPRWETRRTRSDTELHSCVIEGPIQLCAVARGRGGRAL